MSQSLRENPKALSETSPTTDLHDDSESIHSVDSREHQSSITHMPSHVSHTNDTPIQQWTSYVEIPDEVYNRLSSRRKTVIVALLSFCSFLAPISSTAILAAIPEVTATYNTTSSIIGLSNAMYMLFMGLSPCFWGPLAQVYGRRNICLLTATLFLGCSIGTALSPNLASYFVFRILTAFEGTSFLTIGSACIGDIYRPTERATALGWFLAGTVVGPAVGPFFGGLIITYRSWRVIFYLQTALAGLALVGAYFILPETIHHKKSDDLIGLPRRKKYRILWGMLNPWRVVKLFQYPNLFIVSLASSSLVWNMYSLLTPIRYVLNPRFHLTTPIQSGLFYLAPGCGYVLGAFVGGRYADWMTIKWQAKRGGVRVPEDRLRSAFPFLTIFMPACMLIYGWSIEKKVGGIALPVIMMFLQGVAQLLCFPSLNTYCLDVMQQHSAEVIAGNYMIRYLFGAAGTATVLPAVQKIGVGWFSTISALFMVMSGLTTIAAIAWGKEWREAVDTKRRAKRGKRIQKINAMEGEKGSDTPVLAEKGKPNDAV